MFLSLEEWVENLLPKLPTWPFTTFGTVVLGAGFLMGIGIGIYISGQIMALRGF